MHQSSFDKMLAFRNNYLKNRENEALTILDLGSQDINGTYKEIFKVPSWKYIGVDMTIGENVDLVLKDPYAWQIKSNSIDVLISGQAFEHIEYIWLTMLEVARVIKQNGLCCIIVPSAGFEHRYPVDCWRFYPDGLSALARFAHLDVLSVSTQWDNLNYSDGSDVWQDSVLICKKPYFSPRKKFKHHIKTLLLHKVLKTY